MRPIERQTILVTGSTDGLGRAIACELASRGATVLVHGRSADRLAAVSREIHGASGKPRPLTYLADFRSLDAVRQLATDIARDHGRLDVVVNNAAAGAGQPGAAREESADGHELRFAVNYLAPFLLTRLLLPSLRCSAPARIINMASAGQAAIDFSDVMLLHAYDGMRAYCQSKLALIAFSIELAERLLREDEHGVTVNALHPASLMDTKMVSEYFGPDQSRSSIEDGLRATIRLVLDPELETVSGQYFDGLSEGRAKPQVYDADARQELWRLSERLVGLEGASPSCR